MTATHTTPTGSTITVEGSKLTIITAAGKTINLKLQRTTKRIDNKAGYRVIGDNVSVPDITADWADAQVAASEQAAFKAFPGGSLAIIGANAPSGLRSMSARVLICDEVDAYPASAGKEGDSIELVRRRSGTYWNALRIISSTCTLKGFSRIEARYENTRPACSCRKR